MTETYCSLDSHPKFFCNVGASFVNLQTHNIWWTSQWLRKFEDLFCLVLVKFISCFLLHPAKCLAVYLFIYLWSRNPEGLSHLLESSAIICMGPLHVQFIQLPSSSPGKSSFLPKWLALPHWRQFHNKFLQCLSTSLNQLLLPEADMSHCWEMSKFLRHFKWHILIWFYLDSRIFFALSACRWQGLYERHCDVMRVVYSVNSRECCFHCYRTYWDSVDQDGRVSSMYNRKLLFSHPSTWVTYCSENHFCRT